MIVARPNIVEVISVYVPLRKSGKEYSGLCPFHSEKTPSFTVNEDKGVFYCHGCGEGGDAIRFIEKVEGLTFPEALAHLGLGNQSHQTRAEIKKRETIRKASRALAAWALSVSARIGERLRESGDRAHMARNILKELPGADEHLLSAEIKRTEREWAILTTLEEDLLDPDQVENLWQEGVAIEQLVGDGNTYSNEEIEKMFPPLTRNYKQRLTSYVKGET